MSKTLPKIRAGSPIVTNASLNRQAAAKCLAAGLSVDDIAAAWPEVWRAIDQDGTRVLSQRYDYEIDDGSGRYETNRLITSESVRETIARKRKKGSDRG